LKEKEKKQLEKMKKIDLETSRKHYEQRMMLEAMEIESKKWANLGDVNEKIDENVVLPQTVLDNDEYHLKLQKLAFYSEQADDTALQKLLDNTDISEKKNALLVPIYRQIKAQVRQMSYTDEYKLLKEYADAKARIQNAHEKGSKRCEQGLAELKTEFQKLYLHFKKSQSSRPHKKLITLQEKLEDLLSLLNLWTQYVTIVYMPEAELNLFDFMHRGDIRLDEKSIHQRHDTKDMEDRIQTLFGQSAEE